ncbi:MAG: hypothetical protein IJD82_00060, partial [Clostridia bacterium]|nr:hypothetical protein [Clostridia bacterium]
MMLCVYPFKQACIHPIARRTTIVVHSIHKDRNLSVVVSESLILNICNVSLEGHLLHKKSNTVNTEHEHIVFERSNTMKRKGFAVIALVFASVFTLGALASAIVSPALNVLAKENKMIKSGLVCNDVYFSEQDFMKCLGVAEVNSVKAEKLPSSADGVLKLGTLHVSEGQTIRKEYLSMLRFVPNAEGVMGASMLFSCDGTAVQCEVKLLDTVNYAPTFATAEAEIETYCNVRCYGYMRANDPEGDDVDLQVVSYPEHGTLSVTDPVRGNYTYTPNAGFVGSDSFTLVARDEFGNYSSAKSVDVRVTKTGVSFADTEGHWCENAAISLYEAG